jgi:hypothetical protein
MNSRMRIAVNVLVSACLAAVWLAGANGEAATA